MKKLIFGFLLINFLGNAPDTQAIDAEQQALLGNWSWASEDGSSNFSIDFTKKDGVLNETHSCVALNGNRVDVSLVREAVVINEISDSKHQITLKSFYHNDEAFSGTLKLVDSNTLEWQSISKNSFFCPPQAILKKTPSVSNYKHFLDVKDEHKNAEAINNLADKQIIEGYPDSSYRPNATVNRAELLKIIVASKNLELSGDKYQNCFPDVTNQWFAPFVCYAKQQGWVKGYPDGTFKPAQTVSKAESLKMLLEAYNVNLDNNLNAGFTDVDTNAWFTPYVAKAKNQGLLEETGNIFNPGAGHQRGGIAENLFRLLQNN